MSMISRNRTAARMTATAVLPCCTGPARPLFQDRDMGLTWVELLGRYSNRTNWTKRVQEALGSRRKVTGTGARRRTVRRLESGQVAALVEAYLEGATVYELAERFKIHRVTVSEHLHRQGVKMRRQGLEGWQIDEAAKLHEQAWALTRIAQRYGVHASTVWLALRDRGITRPPRKED
jgi:hypothetical protein